MNAFSEVVLSALHRLPQAKHLTCVVSSLKVRSRKKTPRMMKSSSGEMPRDLSLKASSTHMPVRMSTQDTMEEAESNVTLPPQDLLHKVAMAMNRSHLKTQTTVTVPFRTTWGEAMKAVEASLGNLDEEFLVFPSGSGSQRRQLREEARKSPPSGTPLQRGVGLPIKSSVDIQSLPRQPPPTEENRQVLRNMARQIAQEDVHEPFLRLEAITSGYIPTVRGAFFLQAVDGDIDDLTCEVEGQMIFDTGASRTTIAEELLSEDFRRYLKDPIHDPYRSSNGVACRVEAHLALSNHPITTMAVVMIVPAAHLPNGLVGILFGQSSCINRLNAQMTPRSVLIARGQETSDQVWGEITVTEYVNVDGEISHL